MSIWGELGSVALNAYGAYNAARGVMGRSVAPGAGARLATGVVAGTAGYLAGRETGGAGGGGYRRRRARGLSGSDLRGFRRTVSLLKSVGMVPRKLHTAKGRKR